MSDPENCQAIRIFYNEQGSSPNNNRFYGLSLEGHYGRKVYCAGDTNVFMDMQLIQELYQPDLAMLPIGDLYTMSPREAAMMESCMRTARLKCAGHAAT